MAESLARVAPVAGEVPVKNRIELLDYVRGLAIIHIFLYHYYIEWFGGSFLLAMGGVSANLPRLEIFHGGGSSAGAVLAFVKNLFSFLWVYGFASVNLFLLLSGFVLMYSALKSDAKKPVGEQGIQSFAALGEFYVKKLKRLLIPFYITLVIGIGILFLRNVLFPAMAASPVYGWIDFLKTLFVPFLVYDMHLLQRFNGDLWFITLIMQLYILFPFFSWLLRKIGAAKFLVVCFVATVAYRVVATYYLSTAPMGVMYPTQHSYEYFSFFLPRLFEFALGMVIGWMQFRDESFVMPSGTPAVVRLVGGWKFVASVLVMLLGFWLDTYQISWSISDPVISIGLFMTLLNIGAVFSRVGWVRTSMLKLSESSYEIYLLHHYLLNYFLLPLLIVVGLKNETGFWLAMPVFFVCAAMLGWMGQKISTSLANRL